MRRTMRDCKRRLVALLRDEETTWASELDRRNQVKLDRLFIEEQQKLVTERLALLFDEERGRDGQTEQERPGVDLQ